MVYRIFGQFRKKKDLFFSWKYASRSVSTEKSHCKRNLTPLNALLSNLKWFLSQIVSPLLHQVLWKNGWNRVKKKGELTALSPFINRDSRLLFKYHILFPLQGLNKMNAKLNKDIRLLCKQLRMFRPFIKKIFFSNNSFICACCDERTSQTHRELD